MSRQQNTSMQTGAWRLNLVRVGFVLIAIGLGWRLVDLQVLDTDFLRTQGDARHLRQVPVVAHRGMLLDRHGEPLAISTPVHSVWLNPQVVALDEPGLDELADILAVSVDNLRNRIASNARREFVYVRRHITPELSEQVRALNIRGVALQREYKRYYPTGEVTAHLLGFTDIDDIGQEGLELSYDALLTGVPGLRRMVRDSRGNFVGGGELIRPAKAGENIQLSIDLRLQYLAYHALKSAVEQHNASSGSAVIIDVHTGEVLAMVNQPSFNPNNRVGLNPSDFRNRAVIDLFEPGSTVKPFTVVSGLKSGLFDDKSIINTHPGVFRVSGHDIRDFRDYGMIDLATLLQKSSNIAASKIALEIEPQQLWQDFANFGFAQESGAYFPGEAMGSLPDPSVWRTLERATLAYGYGMATSTLQLARAYTVLGNDGILMPVSFVKTSGKVRGKRVFSSDLMRQVRSMMKLATQPGGTATRAAVTNYTIASKTGTARKTNAAGGYHTDRYQSFFAGIIPADNPRLAMAIMIDDPKRGEYFGGLVAAPVFSEVMTGAMRLLNVAPDDLPEHHLKVAQQ